MIFNNKRGNLRNIERFELLPCCHSSSAGLRFDPDGVAVENGDDEAGEV